MTTSSLIQIKTCHALNRIAGKCLYRLPYAARLINSVRHAIMKHRIASDCTIEANTTPPDCEIKETTPIYVMWWQGEDAMPEVVRICYESLKRRCGKHPVKLITSHNFKDFINPEAELPWDSRIDGFIESGRVSLTLLGDLIRTWILYNYGGIWADATLLFPHMEIDAMLQRRDYYSRTVDRHRYNNMYVPYGRWTSFFIASASGNPLMRNIYNGILEIVQENGTIYEYFTMDYIWAIFYDRNKWLRDNINSVHPLDPRFSQLDMNAPYHSESFNEQVKNFPCFKLTYKTGYTTTTPEGIQTVYGHLKALYL